MLLALGIILLLVVANALLLKRVKMRGTTPM